MRRVFWLFLILFCCNLAHADNQWVVTQSTASDCGPAALATLLKYYFDIPTSENEMVRLSGAKPEIGTTFLKLQEAAEAKGCSADSFRMTFDMLQEQLRSYPAPMIVRTLVPQPHFSVLLGIQGDNVFLADPSHGNIVVRKRSFLQRWLIPGLKEKEGFVFIASAPDDHLNTEHYQQIQRNLAQQVRNLQTIRAPLFPFNR